MRDYWPSDWPAEAVVGMPAAVSDHAARCWQHSPKALICTRPSGHSGRHAAGGYQRSNGLCPVYEVWEDDA